MSIIGILASIVVPNYQRNLIKAREAVLMEDLHQMRRAIDAYFADHVRYPDSLEDLVASKYLRDLPRDPFTQATETWDNLEKIFQSRVQRAMQQEEAAVARMVLVHPHLLLDDALLLLDAFLRDQRMLHEIEQNLERFAEASRAVEVISGEREGRAAVEVGAELGEAIEDLLLAPLEQLVLEKVRTAGGHFDTFASRAAEAQVIAAEAHAEVGGGPSWRAIRLAHLYGRNRPS